MGVEPGRCYLHSQHGVWKALSDEFPDLRLFQSQADYQAANSTLLTDYQEPRPGVERTPADNFIDNGLCESPPPLEDPPLPDSPRSPSPPASGVPTWASTRRCLPTGGLQACWWGCVNRPRQPPPRTRFPYHREYNIYGAGVWDVTTIEVDCRRSHLERIADNGLSESLFLFKVTPQHYSVFRSQVGSSSGRSGGRTSSTSSNPKKERK